MMVMREAFDLKKIQFNLGLNSLFDTKNVKHIIFLNKILLELFVDYL